jgi:carbamoyltransferase
MSLWIAAITRGHNSGICLLKDEEIVFAIEEERFTRQKYDGGPLASMLKIKEYTDRLDYLVIAHTQPLKETAGRIDFSGEDMYTGLARKLGLIDRDTDLDNHPQVIDLSHVHHKLHAACAFYRSGFEKAVAVVVDGAGTFMPVIVQGGRHEVLYELESIFTCDYPSDITTVYKHHGCRGPMRGFMIEDMSSEKYGEAGSHVCVVDDCAGIVKAYEAVTQYCGWQSIEAGKTMGLFPYGNENSNIPPIYTDAGGGKWRTADRNLIIPTYPNGAEVNEYRYQELETETTVYENGEDVTLFQNRRDLAYAVQTQSQQESLNIILKAVEITGINNVVFSGGYGLNCVANYFYLTELNKRDIKFYVEPISNDAGTCIGAALLVYYGLTENKTVRPYADSLYLGPEYNYTETNVDEIVKKYQGTTVYKTEKDEVVKLLIEKNIVAIYQGRSENGPRALGNRSILFDPRAKDGKDFVNIVKNREYFRPFAGTVLHEYATEWFDLRGMDESPHMMYAVNCQPDVKEKIPSIIHVDGTCRIQTLKKEQNRHFYELIEEFYKETEVPILFNTSFNLGGEALVETLDDAVRTLVNSKIEYLYLPELNLMIEVKNS